MNENRFDFVIIGAGLAGLYAALNAAKFGTAALITKTTLEISNSYFAQGGIAAAISEDDSTLLHIDDTLKAGRNLCRRDAVDILINEGKEIIHSLIEMGMPFDITDGKISFGLEGGHSKRRVLHAGGDSTGKELVDFILPFVLKEEKIKVYENIFVYELLRKDESCTGIRCFDLNKQKAFNIYGKCIIIASGGGSAIYSRTTNPASSVGEGIFLAGSVGAEIESMEFIQFHPTAFYTEHSDAFLLSEALRGEGAHLVNHEGKRFLEEWNATELSPRDVISKAIFYELQKSGKPNVFLKLDHLDAAKIKKRFGTIYEEVLKNKIDITKDLIPVAPAAHYMVGGIKTGLYGETNIQRLYAAGEAASTGVHGANRLASNSLLECLVFAKRAVEHAAENYQQPINAVELDNQFGKSEQNRITLNQMRMQIGATLWNNVGIVRDASSLKNALSVIEKIEEQIDARSNEYYQSKSRSLVAVAKMICGSALLREESRGCHFRSDFPEEKTSFMKTIVLKKGTDPAFNEL